MENDVIAMSDPLPVAATRIVNTQLITPQYTNELGMCTGGAVLSWIDVAGGMAASRLTNTDCVTASVDAVHFLRPTHAGDILIISAMVNRAFRTSMEVGVRVEAESLHTGDRRYCCSAYLTFVALGPDGRPSPVPQVYPETTDEERRFEAALRRREERLADREDATRPLVPGDEQLALDVHQGRRQSIIAGQLRHSVTRMVHKIFPQHANSVEVTFGGQIMAWMEVGAYVSASRFSHTSTLVLASLDSLSFISPTKVGDLVHIVAKVSNSFTRSLEVMVSVYKNPREDRNSLVHCNSAYMTFVAVETAGSNTVILPRAVAHTAEEQVQCDAACLRRDARGKRLSRLRRPENDSSDALPDIKS